MAVALQNNRGQALIESVLTIPIFILFFVYLIQALLFLTVELAIDDALENYLLCEAQSKTYCTSQFYQNSSFLNLEKSTLQLHRSGSIYEVTLQATVLQIFQIKKKRQLSYETKIE